MRVLQSYVKSDLRKVYAILQAIGQDHVLPDANAKELYHMLQRARTMVRQIEIKLQDQYDTHDGKINHFRKYDK